jgi:hypothetical protein
MIEQSIDEWLILFYDGMRTFVLIGRIDTGAPRSRQNGGNHGNCEEGKNF